jgi:hypothetical protein
MHPHAGVPRGRGFRLFEGEVQKASPECRDSFPCSSRLTSGKLTTHYMAIEETIVNTAPWDRKWTTLEASKENCVVTASAALVRFSKQHKGSA